MGAQRPRLHHGSKAAARAAGGLPQGRQQAGRGCRPSAPSATFEISLSALLPLLGFLRFL